MSATIPSRRQHLGEKGELVPRIGAVARRSLDSLSYRRTHDRGIWSIWVTGCRPGRPLRTCELEGCGAFDPPHACRGLPDHGDIGSISSAFRLARLIIALGLLVDDAIQRSTSCHHGSRGEYKEDAASFAYTSLASPMLTGSFVTAAVRAYRFREKLGG